MEKCLNVMSRHPDHFLHECIGIHTVFNNDSRFRLTSKRNKVVLVPNVPRVEPSACQGDRSFRLSGGGGGGGSLGDAPSPKISRVETERLSMRREIYHAVAGKSQKRRRKAGGIDAPLANILSE